MPEEVNKRLSPGDMLGKYEIVEYVAKGGMGAVYKARDVDLDRIIALKVLTPALAQQPKMLDRFRREARAAARLQHENIVAIYEFGEHTGVYFLALEYVPGVDLQDYIEKRRKLPPDEARQIILQSTRALAHAHDQKVVHRDVKPSNILLTRKDGRLVVKLTDLGLAIQPSDEEFRLTREGTTVGTIDYMAPEQARDSGSADIRSDIYSLGCTFYHILAGTAPFARGTMTERLLQHLQDELPDVRNLNQEVPPGYVAILQRMLAKKPEDRYQTPQELLRDLEDPERAARRPDGTAVARAVPVPAVPMSAVPVPAVAAPGTPAGRSIGAARPVLPVRDPPDPREPAVPPGLDEEEIAEDYGVDVEEPPPRKPSRDRSRESRERSAPMEVRDPPEAGKSPTPTKERPAPVRDAPQTGRAVQTRDHTDAKQGPSLKVQPWMIFTGGGLALGIVVVIGLILTARSNPEQKKDTQPIPPKPPNVPIVVGSEGDGNKKDLIKQYGDGTRIGPERPVLPALYQPAKDHNPIALKREFYGPFENFPQPPAAAAVFTVKRAATPGLGSFRSLAEAFSAAPLGASIIEVQDRGPLYVGSLPALEGRDVFLRAGSGIRPMLVWEPERQTAKDKQPQTLLTNRGGLVVVDGFDIVVKWTDTKSLAPASIFQLAGGGLHVRDCTISLAGKNPNGIVLARLQKPKDIATDGEAAQFRLTRCYARGADMTALMVESTTADVLIADSLLVGSQLPLIRMSCRDEDEIKLRFARSTLVAAQNMIQVAGASGKGGSPRLSVLVLDSIMARSDPESAEGDLLRLADGVEPTRMKWRAVNGLYAGWKKLLAASPSSIGGGELAAWHSQFVYREGDETLPATWPGNPPSALEDAPPWAFFPHDTAVARASTVHTDAVGAPIGKLPPEPHNWLKRAYERLPIESVAGPDPGVPAIDGATDGLYHGERVELAPREDLGLRLTKLLQGKSLAPRIVFHVAGHGIHPMTPLRVKDIGRLIIYFEPSIKGDPLKLTIDPKGLLDRPALFEMERGSLELIGAFIQLENSAFAPMPPHLVKVSGGKLTLHRCRLYGPLGKAPDAFRSLIALAGPTHAPSECQLSECILLSGKGVIQASLAPFRLSARQNVVLALDDALQFDLSSIEDWAPITCQLNNNTWALRKALLSVKSSPDLPDRPDFIVVHADANYFTDPFGKQQSLGGLLRVPDSFLSRGQLSWRGKGNAFDRRLENYLIVTGSKTMAKQSLADWHVIWGKSGESDALAISPAAGIPAINPDAASPEQELERLALPRDVRPEHDNPLPGADLFRLGLLKKKQ